MTSIDSHSLTFLSALNTIVSVPEIYIYSPLTLSVRIYLWKHLVDHFTKIDLEIYCIIQTEVLKQHVPHWRQKLESARTARILKVEGPQVAWK
jgi:hypothetical protein